MASSTIFGMQITPSPSFPRQSPSVVWGQSRSFSSVPLHLTSSIIKSSETWPKCDSLVYWPPLYPSSLGKKHYFHGKFLVGNYEKDVDNYFGPKGNKPADNLGDCITISFRTIVTDRLPSDHDVPFPLIFSPIKHYFWNMDWGFHQHWIMYWGLRVGDVHHLHDVLYFFETLLNNHFVKNWKTLYIVFSDKTSLICIVWAMFCGF